ncbi:MAG: hypothetical protein ACRDHL_06755 [Candidatus Promineifilaceae bacterium]
METVTHDASRSEPGRLAIAGAAGGLVGGLALGALMAAMGMLPTVAGLVGSQSAVVGFLVHIAISLFIGATFGLLFGRRSQSYPAGLGWGLLYGAAWWILGPLVLMPLLLGMGLQFGAAFSGPLLMSLMGHLFYGALTGLAFVWYRQKQS